MDDTETMTAAERWAAKRVKGTTWWSLVGGLVGPGLLIYITIDSPASKILTVLALVLVVFFVVLSWWDRTGFKRLLARRDAEIEAAGLKGESVQQAHLGVTLPPVGFLTRSQVASAPTAE